MSSSAELEIDLRRKGKGDYTADFRFTRPDSRASDRIGLGRAVSIRLDLAGLRALNMNPDVYARTLTDDFFHDPQVKQVFTQARALAEAGNLPLRVRLAIHSEAAELHSVYWEMLQDPDSHAPLFTGENIFFSRYLSSSNMRPIRLRKKADLSALIFIANPSNLADYKLDPINVEEEARRAREGLGDIRAGQHSGPATLGGLVDSLRAQAPAILYLVCHGKLTDEPYLWLEDEGGRAKVTPAQELVTRLKELADPPLLVVLASCDSAGNETAGDARAALGPRLAEAGIPVVLAMQGKITAATAAEFMPAFFRALREDGQVERAVAVARGRIRDRLDAWKPALFSRLVSGSLVEEPEPRPRQALAWWWAAAAPLALLLLAAGWWFFIFQGPMGPGFNIAVAEFAVLDENGSLGSKEKGLAISQGLYDSIQNTLKSLPPALKYETRGPRAIGMVRGKDAAARAAEAQKIAKRWNAEVLIYGVITPVQDGYQVEPAYYIGDPGFRFGMEIAGAERLGAPVGVDLNLTTDKVYALNTRLVARAQALENIVKGLAYFYVDQYGQAAAHLQQAVYLPGWPDSEGKEVLYMMLGSAYLRAYDSFNPDQSHVALAREAFERAREINPEYARAYVGLGSVALAEATRFNPQQEAKLYESGDWLLSALEKRDQPENGYVPIKVDYNMGQIHLLGAEQGFARFSREKAREYFTRVVDRYEESGRPFELIWYAANAHYYLARLRGSGNDWSGMRDESALALEGMNLLNQASPSVARQKARVYFSIGWAEEELGNIEQARQAYKRAIELGGSYVLPKERQEWQQKLDQLGGGS